MTWLRRFGALAGAVGVVALMAPTAHAQAFARLEPVPVAASPSCGGRISAEAQTTTVQTGAVLTERGVRVAVNYDAGVYDGNCAITVTATWTNLDTGATGAGDITAVSTIDGHYGFIGYASTTFVTGSGTIVVTMSSHPDAQMQVMT
ncbi:hypothetical protein [Mycobacterium sp. SMC-4]|uniref:hypothetical protein n=1 Tax=Mycobacterium sp. SMC-4 TaxID=2857059 RepID=UPI003D00FAAA